MKHTGKILTGFAILIGLLFGAGLRVQADGTSGFSLIVQDANVTKGAVVILNCDGSTVTCAVSNGRVNVSAVSGGTGLNQLTQDVLAGPGTGSQTATVVGINASLVPMSAPSICTNSSGQIVTTGCTADANSQIRSIGAGFDGGGVALTVGTVTYFTHPSACTIAAWNITVDTGTITIDVWKIATGTAIPTVANSITASALPAISSGTAIHSTTLTGWTTAVAANDIFGVEINAVSGATKASLVLQCNAS
jgi:hypothetical protein